MNRNYCLPMMLSAFLSICLLSCKKDDNKLETQKPVVALPEKIDANRTLKSDTIYTFAVSVNVTNNAVLTIEPGTVIKSRSVAAGAGRSGYIAIERGSKIMAEGTAEKPIVFTSGTPSGFQQHGDWGGLYIFGKAPVSAYDENTGGAGTEMTLTGLGALLPSGGGNDPRDNSGVLRYVRIEFAGVGSAESYGLACVGVGSGTTIENVQTSYTQTSGFGFFGGTVNAKHLVAFNNRLAGFVYSNGYTGMQQFIVSYKHPYFAAPGPFISTCDALLVLNDTKGYPVAPDTRPVLSNVTAVGPYNNPGYNSALPWNAALNVSYSGAFVLRNSILMGMPKGGIKFSDDIAAQRLMDGTSEFSTNLVHSNISADAFTVDPGAVYSIDAAGVTDYAVNHHNKMYVKPEEIGLTNPFKFALPELLPTTGAAALTGADFSGEPFQGFFKKVNYIGAFGTENWMQNWTDFYPFTIKY
ncbi:hypothetical protein [Chitinophaga sp. W2I13]|uniref:hypothetical protein n=1 Tax=Chitinophaga sp. W2I13 TaxID=3373923 RepID=UPI003D24A3D8